MGFIPGGGAPPLFAEGGIDNGTSVEWFEFGVVLLALFVSGGVFGGMGNFTLGFALHGLRANLRKSLGINGLRNFLKGQRKIAEY